MRSLIVLSLFWALVAAADQDLLARVCDEHSGEAPILNNVQTVRSLIEEHRTGSAQCAGKFADSFARLELVLSEDNLKDICSTKTVDDIEAYHLEFMHFYSSRRSVEELRELKDRTPSERTKAIPRALYQFFVLFAKQASAKCRSQIPTRLSEIVDAQQLIRDQDFQVFNKLFSNSEKVSKSMQSRAAKLLIGRSIGALMPPITGLDVSVAIPDNTSLPIVQQLCGAKFQPVYGETLVAVVRLHNLGYSGKHYDSPATKKALSSDRVARWYQAYQTCEALSGISLVVIPKEACKKKRKCYGFLTEEQAEEARHSKAIQVQLEPVQQIEVAHKPVHLGEILTHYQTQADAQLAVKKFKSHLNREVLVNTNKLIELDMRLNEKLLAWVGLRPLPKGVGEKKPAGVCKTIFFVTFMLACLGVIIWAFVIGISALAG